MKFILILNLGESSELFNDHAKDTVLTIYRKEISQIRRVYIELMHRKLLARTIRSLFYKTGNENEKMDQRVYTQLLSMVKRDFILEKDNNSGHTKAIL